MGNELEAALESLVMDTDELTRLDDALSQFNFFEALGIVRSELRHSDFLGFLLDPKASHGLQDTFLRRFLQRAVVEYGQGRSPISALQLGVWDLNDCSVEREADGIDVLVVSRRNALAVVIENKVDSIEHSNQLARYEQVAQKRYPGYAILKLYLTVDGDDASHAGYVPVSYGLVCVILEELLAGRTLFPDVAVVLRHYVTMLRRHIMDESELATLATSIYERHKRAMDYIFELRPVQKHLVATALKSLVEQRPNLESEQSTGTYVRFVHQAWPRGLFAKGDGRWLKSNRVLVFELVNRGDDVRLWLALGPGDVAFRQRLLDFVLAHRPPFNPASNKLNDQWNQLWSRTLLSGVGALSADAVRTQLGVAWDHFVTEELPRLHEAVMEFVASEGADGEAA